MANQSGNGPIVDPYRNRIMEMYRQRRGGQRKTNNEGTIPGGTGFGWSDPLGAQGAIQGYLNTPLGSGAQEAIAAAGQSGMQQYLRATGSRAGDLASRGQAASIKMQTGSAIAAQKREELMRRLALRSSMMTPTAPETTYPGTQTTQPNNAMGFTPNWAALRENLLRRKVR